MKPRCDAALPQGEWSAWWKGAKENAKREPRLDLSEAYKQIYKIASEDQAREVTLPELTSRHGEAGMGLVKKFLREHPEEEARMAAHAAKVIPRWTEDPKMDPALRAQALCYAVAWRVLTPEAGRGVLD